MESDNEDKVSTSSRPSNVNPGSHENSYPASPKVSAPTRNNEFDGEEPLGTQQSKFSKKRRVANTKRPWSLLEKDALLKHFKKYMILKKVPNKEECMKCIAEETCLSERSWSHVKFQVKNMFNRF